MIGLHHPDLFQGGWKAMNQTTDGTGKCARVNRFIREVCGRGGDGVTSWCESPCSLPPNTQCRGTSWSLWLPRAALPRRTWSVNSRNRLRLPCLEGGLTQGQGRKGWGPCRLPRPEGGTSLPENKFPRCGNLPALILGTQHFEQSFPVYFEDVTFKIFFQFLYFHHRERVN